MKKNELFEDLFNKCVNFLLWLAKKTKTTYVNINIWIFCVILPIIFLLSIGLNIYFLFIK